MSAQNHRFPHPDIRVRRSRSGLGIFASKDIPRGRFLLEYWGKLVTEDEAQRIGGRYLFDLENGNVVVGTNRKNTARYINHACRPNSEVRFKGNRIFIYSIKPIQAGTEITYDYGKEYFDMYIKPYGCRCTTCLKRLKSRKIEHT